MRNNIDENLNEKQIDRYKISNKLKLLKTVK